MYDLYSAQLNDRMKKLMQAGLQVTGAKFPGIQTQSSTDAWMAAHPTDVQGGPFGAQDMGPFQGLRNAKPVRS